MLRHLLRNFQRSLQLSATSHVIRVDISQSVGVLAVRSTSATPGALQLSRCFHMEAASAKKIEPQTCDTDEDPDIDALVAHNAEPVDSEYIQPYRADRESGMSADALVSALRTRFRLSPADVERILSDEVVHRAYKGRSLVSTLDELCLLGVTKRSFMDAPWLITLDQKRLTQKLAMLQTLPIRDINHFVPFLRLTAPRLRKLVALLRRERDTVPMGNRMYYIANRLQVDPYIVSRYLSKRLFVLEMPYEMFAQNLQLMIDYNVCAQDILRDLWAFRYTPKAVQLRLERARRANKDKIMPWMVRCPEPILQRSLKLSLDEVAVLDGKTCAAEYVAERLNFDVETTKAIMAKHPQVLRVRVTKIKEVLDYLLDEAGFTRHEIAQVPRILCHGLETTRQRMEQLRALGCRPSTLVILCRSKREYEKFLKTWRPTEPKASPDT